MRNINEFIELKIGMLNEEQIALERAGIEQNANQEIDRFFPACLKINKIDSFFPSADDPEYLTTIYVNGEVFNALIKYEILKNKLIKLIK